MERPPGGKFCSNEFLDASYYFKTYPQRIVMMRLNSRYHSRTASEALIDLRVDGRGRPGNTPRPSQMVLQTEPFEFLST